MSKQHTDDTFMYQNKLVDDFEDYDTVPRQYRSIDDATMMDWDRVAEERRQLRDWQLKHDTDLEKAFADALDRDDKVNSPSHYRSGNIECIEAIEEALTEEEMRGYFKGNCLKYLWRERYKNGTEDLQKAYFYLGRLIDNLED